MKNTKYPYKFVHVFTIGNSFFAKKFLYMLYNSPAINTKEHLVVVQLHEEYKDTKIDYPNVIIESAAINAIKKYLSKGQYIFVHNLRKIDNLILLRKKDIRRIIWRTWGSDVWALPTYKDLPFFDRLHKPRYYYYYLNNLIKKERRKRFTKNIKAVGCANIVDRINLINEFPQNKFFIIDYDYNENIIRRPNRYPTLLESKKIKIMIGHSGNDNEHHVEILKKLQNLPDFQESIVIIPLSYGMIKYMENVINYCKNIPNVFVIKDIYPDEEWNWILNSIDIAIMDSDTSTGLGNIQLLVSYKKTLYLSDKGVIAKGFKHEGIPFYYTKDIDNTIFSRDILLSYDAENASICKPSKEKIDKNLQLLYNALR